MAEKEVSKTALAIPKGYEEQQTGLPPYWGPNEEELAKGVPQFFHARVIAFDGKDPAFKRWVMQAVDPITCWRGKERAEEVLVKPGEFFSVSHYAGLPLGRYFGFPVFVVAKGKRKIDGGQTVWEWTLRTSPEAAKAVQARQERIIAQAQASAAAQMATAAGGNGTAPKALPPAAGAIEAQSDDIPF